MIHFDNRSDGGSIPSALNLTAIVEGNKIWELFVVLLAWWGEFRWKQPFRTKFPVFKRSWSRCTLQMKLGSSVKKTQEALIIRIAHKTINNEKFMLLLLVVNSNCYCGHLRIKNEAGLKSKFACFRLHFLMPCGKCLHPLGSLFAKKANNERQVFSIELIASASHLTTVDEA